MEDSFKFVYLQRLQNAMEVQKRTKEEITLCVQYAQKLISDGLPVLFDETHVYDVLKWKKSQHEYHVFYLVQKKK